MNTPLLYVERLTKDHKNRLVEYAEIYYRGTAIAIMFN